MERLTEKHWRNLDPWECCGQDNYCKRGCHEAGGCNNGCKVPINYRRLAAYEDTGLTPEQIEAQQAEINRLKEYTDYFIRRNDVRGKIIEALTADKDEQAGRIMRLENMLYQAKDMLQMGVDYLNHDKPFDPLGSMKIAIKAIDALLGGAEDGK